MTNIQSLKTQAATVRDATGAGENTALRVGSLLVSLVDALASMPAESLDATSIATTADASSIVIAIDLTAPDGSTSSKRISLPIVSSSSAGLMAPTHVQTITQTAETVEKTANSLKALESDVTSLNSDVSKASSTVKTLAQKVDEQETAIADSAHEIEGLTEAVNEHDKAIEQLASQVGSSNKEVIFISEIKDGIEAQNTGSLHSPTDQGCSLVFDSSTCRLLLAVPKSIQHLGSETAEKSPQLGDLGGTIALGWDYYTIFGDAEAYGACDGQGVKPDASRLYVCTGDNRIYRWSGSEMLAIGQ